MGATLRKQAADCATTPKSSIFLKSPVALTFAIMRFSPHGSRTQRKMGEGCGGVISGRYILQTHPQQPAARESAAV